MFIEVCFPIPVDRRFTYEVPKDLEEKIEIGKRVLVPFGKKEKAGYIVDITYEKKVSSVKRIIDVIDTFNHFTPSLFKLAQWMSEYYISPLGEVLDTLLPVGLHKIKKKSISKEKFYSSTTPILPSSFQKRILSKIQKSIAEKKEKYFLLFEVNEKIRIEIFLQSIEEAFKNNKQVICIFPEIVSAKQFFDLCKQWYGSDRIAFWHSKLPDSERYCLWEEIINNNIDLLVGTRSAIFFPFGKLGLIIIDEENLSIYKQEQRPFYHLRDVAQKRAELENATLVFGCLTPSVESYFESIQTSKVTLLKRKFDKLLPFSIKIVDLKNEKRKNTIFSSTLREKINDRLNKNEHILLFVNRRGYSAFTICGECGYIFKCKNCDVGLTYHSKEKLLLCHYCNYSERYPLFCPNCKSKKIQTVGFGTERVEKEAKKLFPTANIMRVDFDVIRKQADFEKIYTLFNKGRIDILIATQLIIKDIEFPKVTLIGIISIDHILNLPDFRSSERTFFLLSRVFYKVLSIKKEMIIQTYNPTHYSLMYFKNFNYKNFYEKELTLRKQLMYPPFVKLININLFSKDKKEVEKFSQKIADELNLFSSDEILGPVPAVVSFKRGMYRYQILIKTNNLFIWQRKLRELLNKFPRLRISIDVDPVRMF